MPRRFCSAPHRCATANLYLPEGTEPFLAIPSLARHGPNGKIGDQRVRGLFARHGVAVLAVNPVAQGERFQLVDTDGQDLTQGSTTEHTLLNTGANLMGTSVATYEYWDNVRALDYLETRPDLNNGEQDQAAAAKQILAVLGIGPPHEPVRAEATGTATARTYAVSKYQLIRAGQFPVPCVVLTPKKVAPVGQRGALLKCRWQRAVAQRTRST